MNLLLLCNFVQYTNFFLYFYNSAGQSGPDAGGHLEGPSASSSITMGTAGLVDGGQGLCRSMGLEEDPASGDNGGSLCLSGIITRAGRRKSSLPPHSRHSVNLHMGISTVQVGK